MLVFRGMKKRKVLDIQSQKRRKNRWSIFLDDGSVFGVSEDVFFSIPIHIGDTISEQVLNEILDSESKTKIYNLCSQGAAMEGVNCLHSISELKRWFT